ncbi:MAG: YicC family protein [bacterium]|nr:YicC family protein [bacterium]
MRNRKNAIRIGNGILSMTGFGHHERTANDLNIAVELRSVNNRFFEIGMKIPRRLNYIESDIRERVRQSISRGRVNLLITLTREGNAAEGPLKIDLKTAQSCYDQLEELNRTLGTYLPVRMEHLLHFSEMFISEPEGAVDDGLKQQVIEALGAALDDLVRMRRVEGKSLAEDLIDRVAQIEQIRAKIVALAADQPKLQMEKLQERLNALLNSASLDPGRVEQEFAILVDKLDISEECVRLESHCSQFTETLAGDEPAGKRLGFLLQEMNREVNTISSKSASTEISHLAVSLKEEIERIREQIQNLE